MHHATAWGLAAAALLAGYASFGWRGLVLGATLIVFWLLLQWSRSLRVLQRAGRAPLGQVESAVMLHARLHAGDPMTRVLALTGSLGRRITDTPEVWSWIDPDGARVDVTFAGGRVHSWALHRPGPTDDS